MGRTLVIGTRGSRLALAQVNLVLASLKSANPDAMFDVREIKTEGDRSSAPLSVIGGLGVFTKAIEDALLRGDVDIAVHSLKDLPPELPEGLVIGAVPERGDPRDVLVTRARCTLDQLPAGARVGTGSGRRAVQIKALRPDIETGEIRGNVETRIAKVNSGEYDGAVLAMAGLERLGIAERADQVFHADEMVPAVGQAALGVEIRADDMEAAEVAGGVDHGDARAAVMAERAFLRALGAGCRMPVGAYARIDGDHIAFSTMIALDHGRIDRQEVMLNKGDAERAAAEIGAQLVSRMAEARS